MKIDGFRPEIVEKVMHLVDLLNGFREHPHLQGKLVLKGGTAINLFLFDLPRLSVDIDLNYVGAVEREAMLAERPRIEQAIEAVCRRENLEVARIPTEHAGGKWRLRYPNLTGQGGNLEVDVGFMLRVPLAPVVSRDSFSVVGKVASAIPVLDLHELAAGKLVALFSRTASRDIYDSRALLQRGDVDPGVLRSIFVAYVGMNRFDLRKVNPESVSCVAQEIRNQLLPVLRGTDVEGIEDFDAWAEKLCSECRQALAKVLPFREGEMAFLDALLEKGEIRPELLTDDENLRKKISMQPMLQWKTMNVRKHFGIGD